MGGKLGTLFARTGHDVVFSYARSEEKLKRLARSAKGKARAGTPREAVRDSDALLLAVHWSRIDDVLAQAGDLAGKAVLTCSLPINGDDTALVIGNASSGAEELAGKIPAARVVAASTPYRAKCSSMCTRAGARQRGQAWCTAETIGAPRPRPPG